MRTVRTEDRRSPGFVSVKPTLNRTELQAVPLVVPGMGQGVGSFYAVSQPGSPADHTVIIYSQNLLLNLLHLSPTRECVLHVLYHCTL